MVLYARLETHGRGSRSHAGKRLVSSTSKKCSQETRSALLVQRNPAGSAQLQRWALGLLVQHVSACSTLAIRFGCGVLKGLPRACM